MPATTPVLDNFNRANGALGANWLRGYANQLGVFAVNGNRMIVSTQVSQYTQNYWAASQFGPDCEVYFDLVTISATGRIAVTLRHTNPDTTNQQTGYTASWRKSDNTCTIKYVLAGVSYDIQVFPCVFNSGDQLAFQVLGPVLTAWRRPGGGVWAPVGSVVDTRYNTAGVILIYAYGDAGMVLDNFGGGNISQPGRGPELQRIRPIGRGLR